MTASTAPNHLSIAAQLPAGAYYYLMHTLRGLLPLLLKDSPENRARRDEAAMARIAALCPANIAEAEVAALHVANAEHAKACLLLAQQPEMSLLGVLKCRAQATSMARQADSSLRMLLRMQAARQKIEANPEARDRAAWSEHCALNLMAQALSPPPAPATIPETPPPHLSRAAGESLPPGSDPGVATRSVAGEGAGGEAQQPQPEPAPVARPPSPCGKIEPRSGSMGEGAASTTHHAPKQDTPISPQRAALIRRMKRLDEPDEDLVQALLAAALATNPSPLAAMGATYLPNE